MFKIDLEKIINEKVKELGGITKATTLIDVDSRKWWKVSNEKMYDCLNVYDFKVLYEWLFDKRLNIFGIADVFDVRFENVQTNWQRLESKIDDVQVLANMLGCSKQNISYLRYLAREKKPIKFIVACYEIGLLDSEDLDYLFGNYLEKMKKIKAFALK